jgi:Na+/phosphate symporter
MSGLATHRKQLQALIAIAGHFERIGDYVENLGVAAGLRKKNDIIFSNKAEQEFAFMCENLQFLLRTAGDVLLTKNRILAQHIIDTCSSLEQSVHKFADQHERRLVEGVCSPRASSLYLDIMDSLKGITWHTRQIAERLLEAGLV